MPKKQFSRKKPPVRITGIPPKSKLSRIKFPLKPYQKANLRDFAEMVNRLSNIRSPRHVETLVQKGDGAWLKALLLIPELYFAVKHLIK